MSAAGIILLVAAWGSILGLAAFCFMKVISKKEIK